jgi:RNA polymerase sigma-70 factor (ECF subfamily)
VNTSQPAIALLRSCLRGQKCDDWRELVRWLQPVIAAAIVRVFLRFTGRRPNPDVADDLVQQTYIRLFGGDYRVLRHFENQEEGALLAYVRTIAGNLAVDFLRGARPAESVDAIADLAGADAEAMDRLVLLDTIDQRLAQCSTAVERDREVFWLHYREGLTTKAIAEMGRFDLGAKGVETLLFRLVRCLRRMLAEGIRTPGTFTGERGSRGPV